VVAVPPAVVSAMGPVVAMPGTTTRTAVSDTIVKLAAEPLTVAAVVVFSAEPVTSTPVPTGPVAGLKPVTAGGGITVKRVAPLTVPVGVVTPIGPVTAPGGTTAEISLFEIFVNVAARTPPKVTAVVPDSPVPSISTVVPMAPVSGVMPVMRAFASVVAGVGDSGIVGGSTGGQASRVAFPFGLPIVGST
jgi:hypothetical protein